MAGLIQDGLYDKSQLERDGTQVENQFKGGRLAVWIGGPWVLGSIARTDDDNWSAAARDNVGVAPMPTGPDGKAYTFVGGSNLMMFKSSKHPNEAWALMKYLSGDQTQKDYADLLGMFPSRLEAAAAGRGVRRQPQGVLRGDPERPHLRADPAVGPDRERVQDALRQHPRQRGRRRPAYSDATVKTQLDAAAKEADGLLAQGTGYVAPPHRPSDRPATRRGPSAPGTRAARAAPAPAPAAAAARRAASAARTRLAYWLIAPAVTFMVLVHLLPTVGGFVLSFKTSTRSRSRGCSTRRGPGWRTTARSCSTPTTRCATGSSAPSQNTAVYTFWTVGLTLVRRPRRGAAAQPPDARAAGRAHADADAVDRAELRRRRALAVHVAERRRDRQQGARRLHRTSSATGRSGCSGRTRCGRSSSRASGAACRSRC